MKLSALCSKTIELIRNRRDVDLLAVMSHLTNASPANEVSFTIGANGQYIASKADRRVPITTSIDLLRVVSAICNAFYITNPTLGEYYTKIWRETSHRDHRHVVRQQSASSDRVHPRLFYGCFFGN